MVAAALMGQRHLEIAANNLANVNTVGFKAERPMFELNQETQAPDAASRLGPGLVRRSRWAGSHIDYTGGKTQQTGNPLDLAIGNPGFFVIQSPNGLRYTRAGQFTISSNQEIVTSQGWPLLGTNGQPIRVRTGGGPIAVGYGGEVLMGGQAAGKIQVVDFPRPYRLFKEQGSVFGVVDPAERGTPVATPQIAQGTLEMSNVSAIKEMVGLIETARQFEAYQKVIQSFDAMSDRAVNDLGRSQLNT